MKTERRTSRGHIEEEHRIRVEGYSPGRFGRYLSQQGVIDRVGLLAEVLCCSRERAEALAEDGNFTRGELFTLKRALHIPGETFIRIFLSDE